MRFMHEKAARVYEDVVYSFDGIMNYPEKKTIPKGEDGFKYLISSLLYSMLDVKEENTYDSSNKTKAKTDPLWLKFVGNVEKAKLAKVKPKEISFNRFDKYIHQTLGLYIIFNFIKCGMNINQYSKISIQELKNELEKISDNDKKINRINTYLIESGLEPINKNELIDVI
jgi:hypothetical protein